MIRRDSEPDDCCGRFAESYEVSGLGAMREIERSVLGCDYGGTSWTTRRQAEEAVRRLGLRPGTRLLEVGSGAGWPALFMVEAAGCEAVLVDLPVNALAMARQRACRDGLASRVETVCGSGAGLPFADGSFDAIGHSDVLCCLEEKEETLAECRRVARGGGVPMLFSVIALAPGLAGADRKRAVEAGPPFVETKGDYADLLRRAGWDLVERLDVTAALRRSMSTLVEALGEGEELVRAVGREAVDADRERRTEQIAAIDGGLLRREIFFAR